MVPLPEEAIAGQAKASFEDGVLEITLPGFPRTSEARTTPGNHRRCLFEKGCFQPAAEKENARSWGEPGSWAFHRVSSTHPGESQNSIIHYSPRTFLVARASTKAASIEDARHMPGGSPI